MLEPVLQDFNLGPTARMPPPKITSVAGIATLLFRLSQLVGGYSGLLGNVLKQVNHLVTGLDAAWQCRAGAGLVIYHPTGVVIGTHASLGRECIIHSGVTIGGRGNQAMPTIGNGVSIGAGARVLGPITVGDGAMIGAGAVVVRDVPPGWTAIGVPATNRPPAD